MARKIEVAIVGDVGSYERAMRRAGMATGGFGSKLGGLAKKAGLALGAAGIGGAVVTLKRGFDEISESQKVMAQTAAVIESTGKAANVSAKQVEDFAGALSKKTGIDDEAIQAGQNMLLTFTNIRNEVGKGNDVFNQSTAILADMSVALGKDMSSSAIMLGKALNDPAKGITALTRAGVTFTQSQKDTVKALVASGRTMEAQKLILGELTKEFGGSAEAFGNTLPGQLAKARNAFDEMAGRVTARLLPALTTALEWVDSHWPQIEATFNAVATGVGYAINDVIRPALERMIEVGQRVVGWFESNWSSIESQVRTGGAGITSAINDFTTAASAVWAKFGEDIKAQLRATWEFAKNYLQGVLNVIRGVFNVFGGLLSGDWDRVWKGIQQIFTGVGQALVALARFYITTLTNVFSAFAKALTALWGAAWNALKSLAASAWAGILSLLRSAVSQAASTAQGIGEGIKDGISRGLTGLVSMVQGWFQRLWAWIKGAANSAYAFALNIGKQLIQGIIDGIGSLISSAVGKAKSAVNAVKGAISFWDSPSSAYGYKIGSRLMEGMGHGITAATPGAIAKAVAAVNSLKNAIDAVQRRREAEDRRLAVESAERQLVEARAMSQKTLADVRARNLAIQEAERALHRAKEDIQIAARQRELSAAQAHYDRLVEQAEKAKNALLAKFDAVAAKARAAFDAAGAGFKTPAEKELDSIRIRRQMEDLNQSVADSEQRLNEVRANPEATPEELAAAERALYRAREDVQVASLEFQAAREREAYEANRAQARDNLDKTIAEQREKLEKGKTTLTAANAAIAKALKAQGPTFAKAGEAVGVAFVQAFKNVLLSAAGEGEASASLRTAAKGIKVPELASGGRVLKTGLAVVHRGETFSGVNGQAPLAGNRELVIHNSMEVDGETFVRVTKRLLERDLMRNGPGTLNLGTA